MVKNSRIGTNIRKNYEKLLKTEINYEKNH